MDCENEAFKLQANEAQTYFEHDLEKMAGLGYPGAKISLKEDNVPTLFPVAEAMLMLLIRRTQTQSATWAATTMSLGSKATGLTNGLSLT